MRFFADLYFNVQKGEASEFGTHLKLKKSENDGDHHTKGSMDAEEVMGVQKVAKEVKEIHTMVRSLLSQA